MVSLQRILLCLPYCLTPQNFCQDALMVGLFTTSLATEDDPRHIGSLMARLLPGLTLKCFTVLWKKGSFTTDIIFSVLSFHEI